MLSWVSLFQDAASEMLYPILPLFVVGVLAARFADRLGKGIRGAPRDAMIADETLPAWRGRTFGLHRAADSAGAVIGPLLGLAVYHLVGGRLRLVFVLALVPALVSVALVFAVREHERPDHAPASPAGGAAVRPGRRYWAALGFVGVFALVNFSDAFLLLRAQELGLGFGAVIAVYALYNLTYAGLSLPAGSWSDRVARPTVFAAGLAVFALAYLGLGLATAARAAWVLLPVYGAFTDGQVPLVVAGLVAAALSVVLALAAGRLDERRPPSTGGAVASLTR